jgi:hypothetical protein
MNDLQNIPDNAVALTADSLKTAMQLTKLDQNDVLSIEDIHTTLLILLHSVKQLQYTQTEKKIQFPVILQTQAVEGHSFGKFYLFEHLATCIDFFEVVVIEDVPLIALSVAGELLPSYFAYTESTIELLTQIINQCQNS